MNFKITNGKLLCFSTKGFCLKAITLLQSSKLQDLTPDQFVKYRKELKYYQHFVMRNRDGNVIRTLAKAISDCDREYYKRKNSIPVC